MTYGAGYPTTEDRAMPAVVYVLYFLGLFHGVTLIIGLIIAYVMRDSAGPVNASHYAYLIRTFWIALIVGFVGAVIGVIGGVLSIILVGIPILIGGVIICGAVWLWAMIRCIVGAVRLAEGQPIARPYAYWI
jgi:uncharacterized membrane protein